MERLQRKVDELELPVLPQGVLPTGWDALGRPWALLDCPTARAPQIPSACGCPRVTIAVLIRFPPEPFYFSDLVHLN